LDAYFGGDDDVGVVFYGEVGVFGVFLKVDTEGAVALTRSQETFYVGGLIFGRAFLGEVGVYGVAYDVGFVVCVGLVAGTHDTNVIDEEFACQVARSHFSGAAIFIFLVGIGPEIPGRFTEQEAVRADPAFVGRSEEGFAEVSVGVFGVIPLTLGIGRDLIDGRNGTSEFIAVEALDEDLDVAFAPIVVEDLIVIDAECKAFIEGFFVNGSPGILYAFEGAADSADIIRFREEGLGVIGFFEFEATTDGNGGSYELKEFGQVFGIPPPRGEGGKGL